MIKKTAYLIAHRLRARKAALKVHTISEKITSGLARHGVAGGRRKDSERILAHAGEAWRRRWRLRRQMHTRNRQIQAEIEVQVVAGSGHVPEEINHRRKIRNSNGLEKREEMGLGRRGEERRGVLESSGSGGGGGEFESERPTPPPRLIVPYVGRKWAPLLSCPLFWTSDSTNLFYFSLYTCK